MIGRPFLTAIDLKRLLEAGFVDVSVHSASHPYGPWSEDKKLKKIGRMNIFQGQTGFEAYGMAAFTRYLKMPYKEASKVFKQAFWAVKNKNNHMYTKL
jgi:hypothetical protein